MEKEKTMFEIMHDEKIPIDLLQYVAGILDMALLAGWVKRDDANGMSFKATGTVVAKMVGII